MLPWLARLPDPPDQTRKMAFTRELLLDNDLRLAPVAALVFILEIALFVLSDRLGGVARPILLFLLFNLFWLPAYLVSRHHLARLHDWVLCLIQQSYAFAVILFTAFLSLEVQQDLDLVHMYLMTVIAVASIVQTPPTQRAAIFLGTFLIFAFALPAYQTSSQVVFITQVNAFIFNLVAWLTGQILYSMRQRAFEDRQSIEEKNRLLEEMVCRDSLTGLLNHKAAFERLDDEITRARRYETPLAVIIADVDNFKTINDRFGHLTGDQVLVSLAERLQAVCRASDEIGRYGGEEFILILPQTTVSQACVLCGRLRDSLHAVPLVEGATVTLSAGISEWQGEDLNTLIRITDEKLYAAKAAGKDRCQSELP